MRAAPLAVSLVHLVEHALLPMLRQHADVTKVGQARPVTLVPQDTTAPHVLLALPTVPSGMMATLAPVNVLALPPLLQMSVDATMEHVLLPQSVLVQLDGRPTLPHLHPCATLALKGSFKMFPVTVLLAL